MVLLAILNFILTILIAVTIFHLANLHFSKIAKIGLMLFFIYEFFTFLGLTLMPQMVTLSLANEAVYLFQLVIMILCNRAIRRINRRNQNQAG